MLLTCAGNSEDASLVLCYKIHEEKVLFWIMYLSAKHIMLAVNNMKKLPRTGCDNLLCLPA